MSASKVSIVYDGECPVCRNYSQILAIQNDVGGIEAINARDGGPLVERVLALGYDLDEGFVVRIGDAFYHGPEAIHRLALISGKHGTANRLNFWVFKSERRAKLLYPLLKLGRDSLLLILGKQKFSKR